MVKEEEQGKEGKKFRVERKCSVLEKLMEIHCDFAKCEVVGKEEPGEGGRAQVIKELGNNSGVEVSL